MKRSYSPFGADHRPSARPTESPPRADLIQDGDLLSECYRVQSVLGSGGLGQVYDAIDEPLDRHVALKVSWQTDARLRTEARAIAGFRHPSLPVVHCLGKHGFLEYVVLERIYGVTLTDHLALARETRVGLPAELVSDCMEAVAGALAAVHDAGLAHFDVCPSNVIITPNQRTVLMDLGLAVPDLGLGWQAREAGRPEYLPAEVAGTIDLGTSYRVDLFSLGVTAFELLTGRLPIEVPTLAALPERRAKPAPPVRTLRSDIPEGLASLVDRLLANEPADRPESAEVVRRLLARHGEVESGPRPLKLMIVEDSPFIAKTLQRYAERALELVDVRVHNDAEEAADALKTWEPDVLLLDLHMPKMNGIELCMYMRGAGIAPHAEIISVSTNANPEDRELLRMLGIRHFLTKDERLSAHLTELLHAARATLAKSH